MDGDHSSFDLLFNPRLNKGTAFTTEERERLGLVGLMPDTEETSETQLQRIRLHLEQKPSALEKYI